MALVLRFEDAGASTLFDLLSDGKRLRGTFRTEYRGDDDRVTEVFRIEFKESTKAGTIAKVDAFDDLMADMEAWFEEEVRTSSVFLRWAVDTETAKRALVYGYELTPVEVGALSPHAMVGESAMFDLAITRDRAWEDVTATTGSQASLDFDGAEWDLTGTAGGTLEGRIEEFRVSNGSAQVYSDIWVGIRPARDGVSGFVPTCECENGTVVAGSNTSKPGSVTGASGSNAMYIDFSSGSDAMEFRFYIQLSDFSTFTEAHMKGRYRLVMRHRVTAASTVIGIRLSQGYESPDYDDPLSILNTVYTQSYYWRILELGEVQFPPHSLRDRIETVAQFQSMALNFEAQRLSGTGNLYCDKIYLVPAEHFFSVRNASIPVAGDVRLYTDEAGNVNAFTNTIGPPQRIRLKPEYEVQNFVYPRDGGYVVMVGQPPGGVDHSLTDTSGMSIRLRKRWRTYHG